MNSRVVIRTDQYLEDSYFPADILVVMISDQQASKEVETVKKAQDAEKAPENGLALSDKIISGIGSILVCCFLSIVVSAC